MYMTWVVIYWPISSKLFLREKEEVGKGARTIFGPEPEFLNFQVAQESIPRNQIRQPMKPGGAGMLTLFLVGS